MGGYRVRCPVLVIVGLLLVPLLVAGQEASPGESKGNGDVSKEQVQEEPQPVIAEEVKDKSNKDYISPDDSVSNIENIANEIKSEHENTEKQNKKAKDIFYLKKNSYNPQDADYKDSVALVNKVLEMKGKQNKKKHEEIDFQTLANFVHGNVEDIHQVNKESEEEEEMAAIETAVSNVEEDKKDIGKSVTEELTVKLLEHFKAFEVLALPPLHLACVTSTERDYFPQKQDKGFDTRLGHLSPQYEILQKYVAGANKEGVTMPLKRPFLMSVTPQMNSTVVRASCAWLSTFSNLIPSQMDRHLGFLDIPQPIDERVEIYATGQTIKFCRTFTGFANDWIYRREAKKADGCNT